MLPAKAPIPERFRDGEAGRLVLLGAGHSHVAVLKAFGEDPMPGLDLTLVTRSTHTPYSGMLPGFVSGQYGYDDLHIDAQGLARFAGARLIEDEAVGLDPVEETVATRNGQTIGFDILSIDIGSTPNRSASRSGIPVKPIGEFVERLDDLSISGDPTSGPMRIAVVGTGPAGVELAFALARRLAPVRTGAPSPEITLVGRAPTILPERSAATQRRLTRRLTDKNVSVVCGFEVTGFSDGVLKGAGERKLSADTVLWATESTAAPWLADTGLALDGAGFLAVDECLRSTSHPRVFAAGDIASLPDPRPKAGVFAVREGPVLAQNLRLALAGGTLRPYRPQKHWLTLLSSADGRAVADKWGLSLEGRWVWRWKDWNDRRFVDGYNRLAAKARAPQRPSSQASAEGKIPLEP